jgi:o-succinylbenzoate---CoA ligase
LSTLLPRVQEALDGSGPAVAPIPEVGRFTSATAAATISRVLRPDPESPLEHPDVIAVVPTSGSTGDPKGVYWQRSSVVHATHALNSFLGGAGAWVIALPLTSTAGLMALMRSVVAGTSSIALPSLAGEVAFSVEDFAATTRKASDLSDRLHVSLIDEQLRRLMSSAAGISALQVFDAVLVGGGPVSDVVDRARSEGIRVHTSYGMTETCGGCYYDDSALESVTIDTTDDGRIRIRGPVVTPGYRLRADADADAFREGSFITRDLGTVINGRLHVRGRTDEAVKIDGVLVDLHAVQRIALDITGAHVVVARVTGDRPELSIVVEADEVQSQEIVAAVKERLGARVAHVSMVEPESLPRLPTGKVDVIAVRSGL